MSIVSVDHAHKSSMNSGDSLWSFLRLTHLSPSQGSTLHTGSLEDKWVVWESGCGYRNECGLCKQFLLRNKTLA